MSNSNENALTYTLAPCEFETLKRAASEKSRKFDRTLCEYTEEELKEYGLVREGYTREELRERGIGLGSVSCHDPNVNSLEKKLPVETPFGSGIQKWQLPIDFMPIRVMRTVFAPGTKVSSHLHPPATADDPGGGLRIVTKGKIIYNNAIYGPGDWFYIENGSAYDFESDPNAETEVFYTYRFFGWEEGNRFSHPFDPTVK